MPLRAVSVLSLLLLYLAGSVQIDSFHNWFHAGDRETLHTPEHEKDPCHRTLYHQDRDNGCGHKAHIKSHEKCALCDMVLHTEHLSPERTPAMLPLAFAIREHGLYTWLPDGVVIHGSSRAPPVL